MVLGKDTLEATSRSPETLRLNRDFRCLLETEVIGASLEIERMRFLHPTGLRTAPADDQARYHRLLGEAAEVVVLDRDTDTTAAFRASS